MSSSPSLYYILLPIPISCPRPHPYIISLSPFLLYVLIPTPILHPHPHPYITSLSPSLYHVLILIPDVYGRAEQASMSVGCSDGRGNTIHCTLPTHQLIMILMIVGVVVISSGETVEQVSDGQHDGKRLHMLR